MPVKLFNGLHGDIQVQIQKYQAKYGLYTMHRVQITTFQPVDCIFCQMACWHSFENRMLKNIFVPRKDKVTGDWRELCN